ncbi:MAG: site-specific integrase, partial [Sinobacteraceae bacterium]|nr:site-specific integrase [Nevskiaceae bacterium]
MDAQEWSRGVEDEMRRGTYRTYTPATNAGAGLSIAAALVRYLAEVTPTKAVGSQRAERTHSHPLTVELGGYALRSLTPDVVAHYRDTRLGTVSKRTHRHICGSTVRGELALLSNLYTIAAQEWGVGIVSNPVKLVRKPKAGQRTRRFVGDEESRLLAAIDEHSNPMLGWIVRLALATAMRSTEIRTLDESQVNFKHRSIHLIHTKNGSERTVPLSTTAVAILHDALACHLRRGSTLVFPGNPGKDGVQRGFAMSKAFRDIV